MSAFSFIWLAILDYMLVHLQKIMYFITLVLENLALSSDDNEEFVYCLKVKWKFIVLGCPCYSLPVTYQWIYHTMSGHMMHSPVLWYFFLHMQGWNYALSMSKSKSNHWALYAKSVLDRTRLALASKAEWYQQVLQPSAEYLGSLLGVDQWAVCSNCLIHKTFP